MLLVGSSFSLSMLFSCSVVSFPRLTCVTATAVQIFSVCRVFSTCCVLCHTKKTKGITKKKSWRAWLERLVAGSGIGGGQDETWEPGDDPTEASGDGALMKAVRLLGARLLGLSDPPKAPIG